MKNCAYAFSTGRAKLAIAFHGGFPDGSIHTLDLSVRPGMFGFRESVFDAILSADAIKNMYEGVLIAGAVGELDTVVHSE